MKEVRETRKHFDSLVDAADKHCFLCGEFDEVFARISYENYFIPVEGGSN